MAWINRWSFIVPAWVKMFNHFWYLLAREKGCEMVVVLH